MYGCVCSTLCCLYADQDTHKYCSFSVNCDGSMIAAGTEAVEKDSFITFW